MWLKAPILWWNALRTSLWFVPTICVTLAIILSVIMPEIDEFLEEEDRTPPTWLFAASASGARSILSTVAGSLITIIGVLFSITIVVLQQASTQFTPRVMGNFMRQTGTQLTLGVYLATFLYALLVLRYVRGEDSLAGEFIPVVSVTLSMVLATVCLGFLVYFVHHMATSLQASMVIANVLHEFREDINKLYPEHIGEPDYDHDQPLDAFRETFMVQPLLTVTAGTSGYLTMVDDEQIIRNAPDSTAFTILPQIGDYVTQGSPIVEISGSENLGETQEDRIRECLILGSERSRYQDPLFSIRQLVDIALKALSPSVNDPTTANNAISTIGASLALLANRTFPERIRVIDNPEGAGRTVRVWVNRPTFSTYASAAFSEVRRQAVSTVAVTIQLLDTIGSVGDSIKLPQRAESLHREIDEIQRTIERDEFTEREREQLRRYVEDARARLPLRPLRETGKR